MDKAKFTIVTLPQRLTAICFKSLKSSSKRQVSKQSISKINLRRLKYILANREICLI